MCNLSHKCVTYVPNVMLFDLPIQCVEFPALGLYPSRHSQVKEMGRFTHFKLSGQMPGTLHSSTSESKQTAHYSLLLCIIWTYFKDGAPFVISHTFCASQAAPGLRYY